MKSITAIAVFLALPAVAQDRAPQAPLPADAFRVALHDDADEPGDALWASGDLYKARFDRDLTFHPLLGADAPRSLPVRWQTASVTVGGTPLARLAAVQSHADWRCEIDHGGVVEAYDVRPDGVEQTFTLAARPQQAGDLVIRGRIASELRAQPTDAARQELVFRDRHGRAVVRYGAAKAIDAAGREAEVTTAYDGEHIELRLSGGFLAQAAYPLVVDPLISAGDVVSFLTDGAIGGLSVACADQSGRSLLVAYHRAFSSGDRDVFAYTCTPGFDNASRVLSRTGVFDDHDPCAVFHAASGRFVVTFERKWDTGRNVFVYLHDRAALAENGGVTMSVPLQAGEAPGNPVVGGTRLSAPTPHVMLAYESNRNGPQDVFTLLVDVAAAQFVGQPNRVGNAAATLTTRRGNPSINPVGGYQNRGWVVAYEQGNLLVGASIDASRYDTAGNKVATTTLVDGLADVDAVEPRVAGLGNDYMLAYGRRSVDSGAVITQVVVRRVVWPVDAAATLRALRLVDLGGGMSAERFTLGSLAFDWHTGSHWTLTYLTSTGTGANTVTVGQVRRFGGSGGIVESVAMEGALGQGTAIAASYDWDNDRYPVVYATAQSNPQRHAIRGFDLEYPAGATTSRYGTSCSAGLIQAGSPYAGNENFAVFVSGLNVAQPVGVVLLGGAAANIALAPYGGGYCNLLIDPSLLLHLPVSGQGGVLAVTLPLPDAPPFRGAFRAQVAYLDPAANALGLRTTLGLAVVVQ